MHKRVIYIVSLLVALGWVMLYSASAVKAAEDIGSQYYYLKRQMLWAFMGLAAATFMYKFNHLKLQRLARPFIAIIIILLCLVLAVGHQAGGARRWLKAGFIGFQPSELAKLGVVLALADFIDRKKSILRSFWRGLAPPLTVAGLIVLLIAAEPDLGTALFITVLSLSLLFVAGSRTKHLFLIALAAAPFIYFALFHVGWRHRRLIAFMDPWSNASDASYQLTQSLIALGSGGFLGRGIGNSVSKLFYLPEMTTDFVFSIIGEELGFIGAFVILLLFIVLAYHGFQISKLASPAFSSYTALGITLIIVLQTLINIGVVTGLLPTKGMPLPFISSGGTSLVVSLACIGILLNIARHNTTQGHKRLRTEYREPRTENGKQSKTL